MLKLVYRMGTKNILSIKDASKVNYVHVHVITKLSKSIIVELIQSYRYSVMTQNFDVIYIWNHRRLLFL